MRRHEDEIASALGVARQNVSLIGLNARTTLAFARAARRIADLLPNIEATAERIYACAPADEPAGKVKLRILRSGGWSDHSNRSIAISLRNCADHRRLVEAVRESERTGYHPKGCVEVGSILCHEFAHLIDSGLAVGQWDAPGTKFVSTALRGQIMTQCNLSLDDIASEVSLYAAEEDDPREWFAESLTEGLCSSHPRPVAQAVLDWTKSQLEGSL